MKKKLTTTIIIALILFQFVPIKDFITFPMNNNPTISQTPFIPPDDAEIDFWETPYIHFSIQYEVDEVLMDIKIKNNLSDSITLFNLWIQVNKSDEVEFIILQNTKIITAQNKLSLSTFDTDKSHELFGNGSMIFHIKLYEGEVIDVGEEFNIKLNWYDPDQILAQYDPDLIHNPRTDDIQAFFQHSIRTEEDQPFPVIERQYFQEIEPEEGYKIYNLDFKVTNLMVSDLNEFNFTYIKMKDSVIETYEDFIIESPFLTASEISDISKDYSETNEKIEYKLIFGDSVILGSNEWLTIKTKWIGSRRKSRIENDFVFWSYGDEDTFNNGAPYYLVGLPFYPLLTPAEPIVVLDYDFDGLRNVFELANDFDPVNDNTWLAWSALRGEYYLDHSYAQNLKIRGEVMVATPLSYQGKSLILNLTQLGSDDEIINLRVNGDLLSNQISNIGEFIITSSIDRGVYNIEFTLKHGNSAVNSFYKIDFCLDGFEIPDLTSLFGPDSDGDGLYNKFEKEQYKLIPDADLDGVFDGADLMPYRYLSYSSADTFGLNFPVKDTDSNSDISISIQIKPTQNDYTDVLPYAGNELRILPGIRISGITQQGDYLPDSCFSLDDDKTGLTFFNPIKRNGDQEAYSWAGTLNYKYNNPAQNDGEILLKFTLVWLIFEYNPITGEANFFHVYDNNDAFIIQGIVITENEPTSVVLGIVDDGSNYRKTTLYAELTAHLSISDLSYNPPDIANLEIYQDVLYDIENLNNTRDNLRNQILSANNLDYETTSFIYISYGYSLTYSLETLYDAFPGENPLRTYTPTERNNFYLLPDTKFLGLLTKQVLEAQNVEYLGQIKYGFKNDTETRVYDLQFLKYKYVGSSSEEIFHFIGNVGEEQIEIHLYDLDVYSSDVSTFDSGGGFEYLTRLKVFQFQLVTPKYPGPENFWETQLIGCVWTFYVDDFEAFIPTVLLTIVGIIDCILDFYIFIKASVDSISYFSTFSTVFNKITGPLNIIFGAMRFIFGVSLYFQGAYASGIAEGIRGGLMIAAGVLALYGDPLFSKIAAAAIMVVQLVDWLLEEIFGFNMWAEFVSFFWGIKDANPKYSVLSNSLVYDEAKIEAQGGFEVGDSIGVNINFENTGNTRLTFGLEARAGAGSFGDHKTKIISSGHTGSLTATDTFEYATSSFTLTNIVDMSWYYNPPGRWVVNIIPPFVWWVDPPSSSGGPYYGQPNSATFNIPVFPNSLPQFIQLVKSGTWFPTDVPKVNVETIKDDITPGISEHIDYRIKLSSYSTAKNYAITTPPNGLWNFRFTYQGNIYWNTITDIIIPAGAADKTINLRITPTSVNSLKPGENSIVIRAQDEENPLARTNIILDYNVITIVDFDVVFDPFKPDETELEYDEFIASYINITNIGNVYDTYSIDISGIDSDVYFLHEQLIYVGALATYSAVIGFKIPRYKIIPPGLIEFTIQISSVTDPTVSKVFDCSIDIKQYRLIHFEVEEAALSMTDSDTYVYEFQLTNLGNIDEAVDITYTSVDIATIFLENNYYPLTSGQTEYFNIILNPIELGYQKFNVTASSIWVSETINLSINVVDDDTQHPSFENFFIKDNENWLNISFIAIDEVLGDDQGLSNIDIYVDDFLIHSYQPTPSETIFNFSFTNDWIWTEGIHDIRVNITDADDDRISDDSLSTTIEDTFEVTLDEMYKYVMWLCEDMNNYIHDNGVTALYGVVTQKLVKIQGLLWEAYQLIKDGYLHTGLVRNKMAEIKLEIAETKTELMINKQSMSQEHFEYIKGCIRNIRNKIVELMGLSIGEFSHEISLVGADIYNLRDFVEDNINATSSENLENAITLAEEKLEDAIFDISLDKDTESSLTSAQHALDKAEAEVIALQQKGKISVELADNLLAKITNLLWKVELLKGEI